MGIFIYLGGFLRKSLDGILRISGWFLSGFLGIIFCFVLFRKVLEVFNSG